MKKNEQKRLAGEPHRRTSPWTLTEAKAKFSALVDRAISGEPQRVLRNGREEVVVVDAATFDVLAKPKRSLVELFSALRGVDIDLERVEDDTREVPGF
ncbi:MAG TPA: type II toxin-antitoxin system Phd/YefM family antitoxin [Candidatus Dormibacteraeota bacterium]|nr:type II toxin-antitoxin system Phd/YefM family antitoxin [Candidatus Dormibacteraeota bacterium]